MNLEVANCLAPYKIWTDNKVVKDFASAALHHYKWLDLILRQSRLVISVLFKIFQLFHALFDLFRGLAKSVVLNHGLSFDSQSLHPQVIGILHWRKLHCVST